MIFHWCQRLRTIRSAFPAIGVLLTAVLPPVLPGAHAQETLYVRPGGAGQSGRSVADAFGSLTEARDAVRRLPDTAFAKGDVTVNILPGTYRLPETLAFDARDSGRGGRRVIYRAHDPKNPPVLSGGRVIAGPWKAESGGIFSTRVGAPGVFRQLYVNGVRATVARTPNADDPTPWKRLKQWEPTTNSVRLDGPNNLSKEWKRPNQIEMVVKHHWAVARLHLGPWNTYDNDNVLFPPEVQVFKSPAPKENGQRYYLENALEFLDQPGEWYLDRTTDPADPTVYYKPRPGEDMAKVSMVAPRVTKLITVTGTPDAPVRNLSFQGLRFEHSNWVHKNNNGSEGYVGAQGQLYWDDWSTAPAAVELTYTDGVRLEGDRFHNLGGAGLKLVKGTKSTLVEGCRFTEIGDCGILVYTGGSIHATTEDADQSRDDVIRNNLVAGTGRETLQGTGISVVDAQRIVVENNEVTDTAAGGITVGYFNTDKALSVGNVVRNNYIHDVVTQVDDQAGIYIYSTRFDLPPNPPGNTLLVTGNLIENVRRGPYQDANPIAGFYLDEGARGVTLRNNVVRNSDNTVHVNTWSTEPNLSVVERIVDADPAVEAKAGILTAQWAPLVPPSKKAAPTFRPARLLAHYPLTANQKANAGKGRPTLVGGPTFDPSEKHGGQAALRLNGSGQYVTVPAADLGEEFTVSLWARLEETGADQVLFGSALDDKSPGFRAAVSKEGKILVRDSDGKRGHNGATYPGVFPFGRWNHVTLVMARYGQAARVFVNGADVTRDDHVGSNAFPTNLPLAVGASAGGGGFARGHVADLRIYSGRLRPDQIVAQSEGRETTADASAGRNQ
jgi:hypothetical protein